jgi:hypothetical protein
MLHPWKSQDATSLAITCFFHAYFHEILAGLRSSSLGIQSIQILAPDIQIDFHYNEPCFILDRLM